MTCTHFEREVLIRWHESDALIIVRIASITFFFLERLERSRTSTLTIGCVRTQSVAQSSASEAAGGCTINDSKSVPLLRVCYKAMDLPLQRVSHPGNILAGCPERIARRIASEET